MKDTKLPSSCAASVKRRSGSRMWTSDLEMAPAAGTRRQRDSRLRRGEGVDADGTRANILTRFSVCQKMRQM